MTNPPPDPASGRVLPALRLRTMERPLADIATEATREMPTFSELSTMPTMVMEIVRTGDTSMSMSMSALSSASGVRSVRHRIFSALFKLISFSLMVRFLSLIAQVVISYYFGAGAVMDGFFSAQTLPTVLTSLVVGALEVSVVPTFVKAFAQRDNQATSRLFSTILNAAFLVVGLITVLLILGSGLVIHLVAPKLSATSYAVAVQIAPLVFPTFALNVIAGYLRSILNTRENFGLSALAEGAIPIAQIVGTVYCIVRGGSIEILTVGLLIGTVVQVGWLFVQMRKTKLHYRFTLNWRQPELRHIVQLGTPVLFSSTLILANPLVDQIIASTLNAGTISAMNFALKLVGVISTLLFVTMSRAVFPYFSRQAAVNNMAGLKQTMRYYVWLSGAVTSALAVVLFIGAPSIVRLIYQHGQFTSQEADTTVAILRGFLIGLPAMGIGFIVPRAFSAIKRNDVLLWLAPISLAVNAVLDVVLSRQFGPMGIALSTSCVYVVAVILELSLLGHIIGPLQLFAFADVLGKRAKTPTPMIVTASTPLHARLPRIAAILQHRVVQVVMSVGIFITLGVEQALNLGRTLRLTLGVVLVPLFLQYPIVLVMAWSVLLPFNTVQVGGHDLGGALSTVSLPAFLIGLLIYRNEIIRRHPGVVPLVAFLMWAAVGALQSSTARTNFVASAPAYLSFAGIMLFTTLLASKRQIYLLIDTLLVVAVLVAGYAVLQNHYHFGTYFDGGKYRAQSIFDWSNTLGYYLDFMLPLVIFRAFFSGTRWRIAWAMGMAIIIGGIYATYSRESEIAALVGVLVILFIVGTQTRLVAMALGLMGVLVVAIGPFIGLNILGRFGDNTGSSLDGRSNFWSAVFDSFRSQHFLGLVTGQGFGAADKLVIAVTNGYLTSPHNIYLELLYDTGIVGVVMFALALLLPLARLMRHRADSLEERGMRAMGAAVIVSIMVFSITESQLNGIFSMFFWLIMSLPFARAFTIADPPTQASVVPQAERTLAPVGATISNTQAGR